MEENEFSYTVYSPASVIGIFSNALKLNATVNLIYLKGRYAFGGGKSYGNYYYDLLFSEGDHTSIGVRISSLLRSKISNNEIYTLRGFIEKNIKNSSIELRFVVDEIIQQEEKSISEEELERYGLIQKKLEIGSKDLETLIRDKMLKDEAIRVANIYGNNAIVQKDFSEGLDVSSKYFEISDHTCNITSPTAIISKLKEVGALNYDIVALVRGGGDRQSMETLMTFDCLKHLSPCNPLQLLLLVTRLMKPCWINWRTSVSTFSTIMGRDCMPLLKNCHTKDPIQGHCLLMR